MDMDPNPDPTKPNPRRLTNNVSGEFFPVLSPDGKKLVFESNRDRAAGEPANTSDLFLMEPDGTAQRRLTRGSSATWSPDGKRIAFHASASGTGRPIETVPLYVPGVPTTDSDIFVANVDDLLDHGTGRTNLTNTPQEIESDADWSRASNRIVFTSRVIGSSVPNDIYVMNADGTGRRPLTNNTTAEAAPSWSPDGTRIAYMCTADPLPPAPPPPLPPPNPIEICVMNADGSGRQQLTTNTMFDGGPVWSPDGNVILFGRATGGGMGEELFVMNADGTGQTQRTDAPGHSLFASWGVLRVKAP
jgi:TolB protein